MRARRKMYLDCDLVLISDGNPKISAHVRSNIFYLILSRHLIRSRVVTNRTFFVRKRPIFLHACATWPWVTRSTMDCCLKWYKFKLRCVIVKGYWHARVYSLRGEFSNFKRSDTHIIWTLGVTTNKPFYVKWVLPSAEIQSSIQNTT